MTREELEKRLESAEKQMIWLQDEIQNLKAKLAEAEYEPEIPDFPVFGTDGKEQFWCIDIMLEVDTPKTATEPVEEFDYNFFHTKEYAQEFADKCKLIAMMLHCKWYLCPDYVPDFTNSNEEKYYVYYDVCNEKYTTDWRSVTINNEVFFNTKENAQKCAEWLNEHWRDGDAD